MAATEVTANTVNKAPKKALKKETLFYLRTNILSLVVSTGGFFDVVKNYIYRAINSYNIGHPFCNV